jgi:antitoxin component of MazEF toxin-antitoxin module
MTGMTAGSVVEIIAIGDELGIVFPDHILQRFGLEIGDHLTVSESPNGIKLTPPDAEKRRAIRQVMDENHDVLKQLAEN